mgnify:FL=1
MPTYAATQRINRVPPFASIARGRSQPNMLGKRSRGEPTTVSYGSRRRTPEQYVGEAAGAHTAVFRARRASGAVPATGAVGRAVVDGAVAPALFK